MPEPRRKTPSPHLSSPALVVTLGGNSSEDDDDSPPPARPTEEELRQRLLQKRRARGAEEGLRQRLASKLRDRLLGHPSSPAAPAEASGGSRALAVLRDALGALTPRPVAALERTAAREAPAEQHAAGTPMVVQPHYTSALRTFRVHRLLQSAEAGSAEERSAVAAELRLDPRTLLCR